MLEPQPRRELDADNPTFLEDEMQEGTMQEQLLEPTLIRLEAIMPAIKDLDPRQRARLRHSCQEIIHTTLSVEGKTNDRH